MLLLTEQACWLWGSPCSAPSPSIRRRGHLGRGGGAGRRCVGQWRELARSLGPSVFRQSALRTFYLLHPRALPLQASTPVRGELYISSRPIQRERASQSINRECDRDAKHGGPPYRLDDKSSTTVTDTSQLVYPTHIAHILQNAFIILLALSLILLRSVTIVVPRLSPSHQQPFGQNEVRTPVSKLLFATTTPNSPSGTTHSCFTTSQIDTSYCDSVHDTCSACHG